MDIPSWLANLPAPVQYIVSVGELATLALAVFCIQEVADYFVYKNASKKLEKYNKRRLTAIREEGFVR